MRLELEERDQKSNANSIIDLALQGQRRVGEPELLSLQHWHYGYISWHHLAYNIYVAGSPLVA